MNTERALTPTDAETTLIRQLDGFGAKEAANSLAELGLPTRRVEAYHYTDLRSLMREVPDLWDGDATKMNGSLWRLKNAFEIPLLNGDVPSFVKPPFGIFVAESDGSGLSERDDFLVSLNRSLVSKSLLLRLEGKESRVIHLQRHISGDAAHVAGSVMLDIAAGAEVVVLETFDGSDNAHLGNYSTRVLLGNGAKLTHIIVNQSSKKATHFHTIEYIIGTGVELGNLIVNEGAKVSRTQMFGRFEDEGSHANLSGLNLVDDGQHSDITMDMTHAAPNTSAEEKFKAVVRNRAKAVFQGRIVVDPVAQKTDAKMMAQGLMLSEGAQIFAKPELEIFADDVQCGHGCTCGELDADALFYLMSRGIPEKEASSMLTRAFIQELLDPIENEELSVQLSRIVSDWLKKGAN